MADPLVGFEQLEGRPGFEFITAEQVTGLLHDASGEVRLEAGGRLDDVATPLEDGNPIVGVIVNMVRRGLRNPMGASQQSLGDFAFSMGGQGVATVYLTRRERRIVRRAVGIPSIGSQPMTSDLPTQLSELETDLSIEDGSI